MSAALAFRASYNPSVVVPTYTNVPTATKYVISITLLDIGFSALVLTEKKESKRGG